MKRLAVVKRKSQGKTERFAVDRDAFSRNVFDRWVAPLVTALTDDYRRMYKGDLDDQAIDHEFKDEAEERAHIERNREALKARAS